MRQLWEKVIHHKSDNIFTAPQASAYEFTHAAPNRRQTSPRSMDEECRTRLAQHCKELDESFPYGKSIDDETQTTPRSSLTGSPDASDNTFPTLEILDSSLDFFFQFFHPILPFMHKSTFDPRNTPSPLLLAMCLVGLSYVDRLRTRAFVSRYLNKLMQSCVDDMASQALGQCTVSDLLATLASTLMVVYLALGFRDEIDQSQAYMLCAQMLSIADKQGLFAANQGDDPTLQLRQGPSDPEGFWKAWTRVESVKRLIFCFVWLDMAYARLMNTAGVIEIDKVELHLPCDDALFDGPTSAAFLQAVQQGAQLTMQRMKFRNFYATSTPPLNDTSTQILLRGLYLRVIAVRTKLSGQESQYSDLHPASHIEALAAVDSGIKDIITDILLLPSTQASVLKSRNRMNALGWHYLCITLTADMDLLEAASGRDGLEAASAALVQVVRWSRSASARRAVLHAAQVFEILDSSRIRESYLTRPDLVLFVSALVISQYILVSDQKEGRFDANPSRSPFELLQNIDWTVVGDEGLVTANETIPDRAMINGDPPLATSNAARQFIQLGGPISFAGEIPSCGSVSARKIVRKFAHLMAGFGTWDESGYSELLSIMCDSVLNGHV
ncbi:fungal-specific transcription factor domain-containing protein [Dactylonectria macrodidyma]|uniref:Fungal-specific transcription factor domain-containing protein n=1 Tax=Dactylonectria macrodidyma TaxID=307937 RepID=A0A9P9IS70_9HYPO|nr:fungal-specific transcription factor domain-containing protein [Dactylonectria macrodidyma]